MNHERYLIRLRSQDWIFGSIASGFKYLIYDCERILNKGVGSGVVGWA